MERGWHTHIIILRGGVNYERLKSTGATIHKIDASSNYDLAIVLKILKVLSVVDPVVVHCWQRPMDIFGALAAVLARRPFISVERTSPLRYERSIKGALKVMIAQLSSAVISNSADGRDYWERRLIRKIPNIIVPNIIPFDELARTQTHAVSEDYIIAAGRLSNEKNFVTLLSAIKLLVETGRNTKLHILGDGPARASLTKQIGESGLENFVTLLGYRDDVWCWMKNARVFVSLSLYEGLPNTVLEAAALNVPLLLSDIPAHRAYFDEESAEFVVPQDAKQISAVLANMLRDPERSQQKARTAARRIERNTVSEVTERHIELYNKIQKRR